VLWATLVILIDAVIQGLTGRELILGRAMTKYYEDVGRVTATFVHANDFSAFLSVMLFFYLGALMSGRDSYPAWKRVVWAIGLILSFICLLWTYSRGAWFAVLISFVLSMLFRRNWKLIAAFAALLAAGIFFAPPALKQRFDSVKSLATSGTVVERKILWGESVRMIQKSPWLGLGVNTYARNEPLYKEAGKTDYQYAHNGYLQIGAEVGLLGLGAFMLIVLYFLFYAVPGLSASGGMGYAYAFGITAFLIHSAADTNLQSVRLINLLWLLWGLGFSYRERHS
jgi:O-antigen ligase